LLEWQRGNRFELRIFPIPKRGSRRIVLAYTQVLAPSEGGRQYVYPLPLDPGDDTRIERFTFEAQLRGHDAGHGVATQGYVLTPQSGAPDVARLAFEARDFAPLGDLVLSYQLENAGARLRAWAYQPSAVAADARTGSARPQTGASGVTGDARNLYPASSEAPAAVADDAAYVAIAIRPNLPRRAARDARDYVLIADSSRSMLGENYRRARAVVTRSIREMDRHDRVTVLACDSVCQSLPGGFLTPGDDSADLAGRFLSSIEPEGASDLAFAVEQASALARPSAGRVLRVVYVGDGTPSVGPIHPALVRRAVADALPRGATFSAVALGSDADHATLRVATQAGGGVSLTFAPGQAAEEVAYALLGATYGQTLQNARIQLPEGMVAVAPSELGSLAAGAEQLVVARLLRPRVEGQVVLAGLVAGEPFEQSYPIEVSATSGQANAFVPRLYAAVAIAELEGSMDEGARRRSIELSTRFNVASRYTSLLVLESPAMFKAFGLDNQRAAPLWGGEQASEKSEQAADALEGDDDAGEAAYGSGAARPRGVSSGAGPSARELAAPAPRSSNAPSSASTEPGAEPEASWARPEKKRWAADSDELAEPELGRTDRALELLPPPEPRLIPMRKVWDRVGRIDAPPSLLEASSPARRQTIETRSRQQADHRSAIKDLYVVDFLAGDLESAARSVERWSDKDPLDPDALTARADLAAQRGLRDQAIRRLGSVVDVRPGDYKAQWRLARLHRWAGDPARGCRHSLGVAQLMLRDPKLVAQALGCAREVGQSGWVTDLLAALDPEVRREVLRRDALPRPSDELTGDFRILAKWQGTEHDLDLVIIHPEGYRVSWLGAPTASVISANDVLSLQQEGLALRGAPAGQYAIELVRSNGSHGTIYGNVDVDVGDSQRNVAFVMDGDRLRVATARISVKSRLVPLPGWDVRSGAQ
jgi:Mg-chelatase subunit ChlD